MIRLFLLSFVASALGDTDNWTLMRVKYGNSEEGRDISYLFEVQSTLQAALAGRWKKMSNISNTLGVQFVGVDPKDAGFTPMYDRNGNLVGAQLCQPAARLLATGPPSFDPLAAGTNEALKLNDVEQICSSFLIVDPATIKAGGRSKIVKVAEGLWVRDTTSEIGYRKMPTKFDRLVKQETYTKQSCLPGMGDHYLKNVTKEFDCNKWYPWDFIGLGNDVHALAYQTFGYKTVFSYDWYDITNKKIIQSMVPDGSPCLYDWAEKYATISIHVYFVDKSWNIKC